MDDGFLEPVAVEDLAAGGTSAASSASETAAFRLSPTWRILDETDNHMEREPEDEGDDAEDEPSLGSLDRPADQTQWAKGSCDDAEHEHDGREPDDSGIGDADGLLEQVGSEDWRPVAMV